MGEMSITNRKNARANSLLLQCYLILNIIFTLAYLLEFFKGERTISYIILFLFLTWAPWGIGKILQKKQADSLMIRRVVVVGYAVFYAFVLATTVAVNAFVYAVPMLVLMSAYANIAYTMFIGVAVVIVNIVVLIYKHLNGLAGNISMAEMEIQVLVLFIIALFLALLTKLLVKNSEDELAMVNEEKKKADELVERILSASGQIKGLTGDASDKMNLLQQALNQTMSAMQEVNKGTTDTVNAVSVQLEKTEEISRYIANVEAISQSIAKNSSASAGEIEEGQKTVNHLIDQVKSSTEAGKSASEKLDHLNEAANQMGTIVSVIDNVTEQTGLLALNASIEAARAGEAGRGFAVVASEISSLAGQTSDATVEITNLVNSITDEIKSVVKEISNLLELTREQAESATKTAENFGHIAKNSMDITNQSSALSTAVNELADANAGIVESIQTISAISEEVTAHSNETYNNSEENERSASQVVDMVQRLHELADELNA